MSNLTVPEGFRELPVRVWTNGLQLIIEGDPPDEETDPVGAHLHDCDQMGCGWCHVLARIPLDPHYTLLFLSLISKTEQPR